MESELLLARVSDVLEQSVTSNKPKFLGFLSLEESVLVKNFLEKRNAHFCLYGGYQDSQRKMLCCCPEWSENPNFPITALSFKYRNDAELKHRDFLGSLMALGIKRETVGDILIENGRTVAFLKNEVVDFVVQNVQKVGNTGVGTGAHLHFEIHINGEKVDPLLYVNPGGGTKDNPNVCGTPVVGTPVVSPGGG
jgi:RNA-binding protein YlmH